MLDQTYGRCKKISNIDKNPEDSETTPPTTSTNVVVNNVEVSDECQWRLIPHKRGAPPDSLQVKMQNQFDDIKLDNSLSVLSQSENYEVDQSTQIQVLKPPPVFIPNVTNVKVTVNSIQSDISKDEYVNKWKNENTVKINTASIEIYRKLG